MAKTGNYGQLGHRDTQNQLLPKKVEALAGRRVIAVSAGRDYGLALTADGAVWSWGFGGQGRLGHGDRRDQLLPKKVEALAGRHVVAVSAGTDHSIALAANGAALTWGRGNSGRLGHLSDQLLPKKVAFGLMDPTDAPTETFDAKFFNGAPPRRRA